jgi:hypothetical protein
MVSVLQSLDPKAVSPAAGIAITNVLSKQGIKGFTPAAPKDSTQMDKGKQP